MADDERADRLAAIAVELVVRVRDEEPAAVHRWLQAVVADNDMMALAVILAAAVPDDRTWDQLTAWVRFRDYGDGRPDTPEKIALRRAALDQALNPDSYMTRRVATAVPLHNVAPPVEHRRGGEDAA